MRRLILFRHAKTDRPEGVRDVDRPLAGRGRRAAPRMGAALAEAGLIPDLALVSPARRATETWDLAKPALGTVPERSEPRLYEASVETLLAVVRETDPGVGTLLMVGHNPGFERLAARLVGEGDAAARDRLAEKFPTAAVAVIDFPTEDWRKVAPGSGRLERFVTPRSLESDDD
jgi:phosphohistidine phosphatase